MPCARRPNISPASTSPDPAVASVAGALAIDDGAAVRRRNDGIGALEHDDRTAFARGRARAAEFVAGRVEQTRELALVRREHTGGPYGLEQLPRARREHADGIGVEHHRTAGCEHRQRPLAGRVVDARTGSYQKRRDARIRQQTRKIVRLRERAHHDAGERRRVHRKSGLGNRDGGEPGADASGGARRQARRAGDRIAAAQQCMSARVLVARGGQPRQLPPPKRRIVFPGVDGDALEHGAPVCRCRRPRWRRTDRGPAARRVPASCG